MNKHKEKQTEIGTNGKVKSHCRDQGNRVRENTTEQGTKHSDRELWFVEREAQKAGGARPINGAAAVV